MFGLNQQNHLDTLMDFKPLLLKIAQRISTSISQNFREGGRPNRWKPSKRTKTARKSKTDKKTRYGKTLVNTGTLQNSINTQITNDSIIIGTGVIYARTHQFGDNKTYNQSIKGHTRTINQAFGRSLTKPITVNVRSHSRNIQRNIPARPFLMIQEADKKWIKSQIVNFLKQHLTGGRQ